MVWLGLPQKKCTYAESLEENWGKPPGNLNSNGQQLLIYGRQFGNIFIGVQPTFGCVGQRRSGQTIRA